MDKKTILKVVNFLADCLTERGLNVKKIILFGSQARGNPTEESDIDLAVVSEDFRDKGIFDRIDLIGDAEYRTIKKFMLPMDIITMSPEDLESDTSLIADYVKMGKTVYSSPRGRRKSAALHGKK